MAQIVYPFTLTAGQPENVNQLNSNLNAITAQVNGNLDATNMATAMKPATLLGSYRTEHSVSLWIGGGTATGTYLPNAATNGAGAAVASGLGGAWRTVYLDPVDFGGTGATAKLRVRLAMMINNTAPTSTFSAALFPLATNSGAANLIQVATVGAAVGTTTTLVAPFVNTAPHAEGSDIDIPTAGQYLLGLVIAGSATAANAAVNATISLQSRHV
jgi:hypothetical protein